MTPLLTQALSSWSKTMRYGQFGILSLLLAITLVSFLFAYLEHTKVARAIAQIERSGARITHSPVSSDGQQYIEQISFQSHAPTSNRDLEPIATLTNVDRIDLDYTLIDDISSLSNLTKLQWLDLEDTNVDSDDLVHLEKLDKLHTLVLTGTKITDRGLECIADMTNMVDLRLNRTRVTDACLEHVYGLKNLRELNIENTKITRDGYERLRSKLPNCDIEHSFYPD